MSPHNAAARPPVAAARRIVLKLGTRVLTQPDGRIALSRLFSVVETAGSLVAEGREVLLVSSGAVGLGRDALGLQEVPDSLEERQACAAVGQSRLMSLYQEGFSHVGLLSAQVLLTQGDFEHRLRYLNLRSTLTTLLRRRVVPVINENDAVSTEELAYLEGARRKVFGDNDRLSALVAAKLGAELLVLLTDVPGVFEDDPRSHPGAALLSQLEDPEGHSHRAGGPGSRASRGGMRSKLEAAALTRRSGCHTVIASGLDPEVLRRILAGEEVGTWIPAQGGLDARRRWIAFASAPRGILHLDAGAVSALRTQGASLLAAGVRRVEGEFKPGDTVDLVGPEREHVGRGVISCGSKAARAWCAGLRPEGSRNHPLIRRDDLVMDEVGNPALQGENSDEPP
jgi:glutamate 5-kinase